MDKLVVVCFCETNGQQMQGVGLQISKNSKVVDSYFEVVDNSLSKYLSVDRCISIGRHMAFILSKQQELAFCWLIDARASVDRWCISSEHAYCQSTDT